MDIEYFAVINFVDFIQKTKKEYDGTYSFSVLLFIRQFPLFFLHV